MIKSQDMSDTSGTKENEIRMAALRNKLAMLANAVEGTIKGLNEAKNSCQTIIDDIEKTLSKP